MKKQYYNPEFKVLETNGEDVLTTSTLDDMTSGWETGSSQEGGGTIPIISL